MLAALRQKLKQGERCDGLAEYQLDVDSPDPGSACLALVLRGPASG